jgi:HEAT repeat protein
VRTAAALALARIGDKRAIGPLKEYFRDAPEGRDVEFDIRNGGALDLGHAP